MLEFCRETVKSINHQIRSATMGLPVVSLHIQNITPTYAVRCAIIVRDMSGSWNDYTV
jgi:hypothetical protein